MSQLWAGVEGRIDQATRMYKRAALGPALVRLVILVAASAALFLAFPVEPALQCAIIVPILFPRTFLTTAFILLTVLLWLVSTGVAPDRISLWRVCALAIALYVVHIGAALASVLPFDAVLTPGLFRPWLLRILLVSVLTVAVGLFIFTLQQVVSGGTGSVGATLGGFVLLVTTAILLTYLGNRRQ